MACGIVNNKYPLASVDLGVEVPELVAGEAVDCIFVDDSSSWGKSCRSYSTLK